MGIGMLAPAQALAALDAALASVTAGAYHLLTIVHFFKSLISAVLKPTYYHSSQVKRNTCEHGLSPLATAGVITICAFTPPSSPPPSPPPPRTTKAALSVQDIVAAATFVPLPPSFAAIEREVMSAVANLVGAAVDPSKPVIAEARRLYKLK
jgi:hypothetical protein